MLQPVNYAQLLFPDFSLILIGFLVCRFTALNRSVWGQIDAVVYYLLFPVLLFHSIVKSPLDLGTASPLIFAGWALCLSGIAMAYALPYLPWIGARIDRREHAAGAQVAFRFNTYIGLALAERLRPMVADVPPVPAPQTTQAGSGWGSRAICAKIDSAMLLLPRQSVTRSA